MEAMTQRLISVPCAVLGSTFAYNAADQGVFVPKEERAGHYMTASRVCILVFAGHIVVHNMLLLLLPSFAKDVPNSIRLIKDAPTKENSNGRETDVTYTACQETCPASWFSTNPVHCLRSKYLHKHSPPCHYYLPGKEHLLEVNPEIGCHYHAAKQMATYSDIDGLKRTFHSAHDAMNKIVIQKMFRHGSRAEGEGTGTQQEGAMTATTSDSKLLQPDRGVAQ
eukprot:gnl/MRDRNA2_/MRDRNA2_52285_c0_seq1.p1 gnl/MRDRNA2_/MRDRNA2_52285_c0~~gnl/MRDRNA2_/MRDRNA2_52285_c0_seq1.p1  ORF type:complete len:231 (+),score=25.34 gnl/MRDRNA2_/MRDRNA2_52285_c0_seq1:27-695(+)